MDDDDKKKRAMKIYEWHWGAILRTGAIVAFILITLAMTMSATHNKVRFSHDIDFECDPHMEKREKEHQDRRNKEAYDRVQRDREEHKESSEKDKQRAEKYERDHTI